LIAGRGVEPVVQQDGRALIHRPIEAIVKTARMQPVIQVTVHVGLGVEGIRMRSETANQAANRRLELRYEDARRWRLRWPSIGQCSSIVLAVSSRPLWRGTVAVPSRCPRSWASVPSPSYRRSRTSPSESGFRSGSPDHQNVRHRVSLI